MPTLFPQDLMPLLLPCPLTLVPVVVFPLVCVLLAYAHIFVI